MVCYETAAEKQAHEERSKLGSQLTDLIQKITELITGIQIAKSIEVLSSNKTSLHRNSQGK